MNENLTINERLIKAGVKTNRGFTDKRYKYNFAVLEYNGISVKRPRICMFEYIDDICKNVFEVKI